jgi:hypothetical protein
MQEMWTMIGVYVIIRGCFKAEASVIVISLEWRLPVLSSHNAIQRAFVAVLYVGSTGRYLLDLPSVFLSMHSVASSTRRPPSLF